MKPHDELPHLDVKAVVGLAPGRVAVIVDPPEDLDLQYIYRAAQSVYWNPAERRLEDRYLREESQDASFCRISGALLEEYGLRLRLEPSTRWDGVGEDVRKRLEG